MWKGVFSLRVAKQEIAARWEKLSTRARSRNLGEVKLWDLAQRAGFDWYTARGDESLADFLGHDGVGIFKVRGLGKTKVSKLCDILEELTDGDADEVIDHPFSISPFETLKRWNIPVDFPYDLIALPVRLIHYFEENGITTLGGILDEWNRLDATGLKAKRNIGRKSVEGLSTFVDSLISGDVNVASQFLPLGRRGVGTDFAASLVHVLQECSPVELELLQSRLHEGMTLEESAGTQDLTRERVRQMESKFLKQIQRRLDFFTLLRDGMLGKWLRGDDWFALVEWDHSSDGGRLAKAALEAIFKDSAQGIAKDLARESRMEELEEALELTSDFWFGGVILDDFLLSIPLQEREAFCMRLMEGNRFRLDQSTGRVHPRKTNLRRCTEAMLKGEDDPLPLTWILELIRRTGFHPNVERHDLLLRRSIWAMQHDFPDGMILWLE